MSAKCVYGTRRTWHKAFWAYGVDRSNRVTLVACESSKNASLEKEKLKDNDEIIRVGATLLMTEISVREIFRSRGAKIEVVREQK